MDPCKCKREDGTECGGEIVPDPAAYRAGDTVCCRCVSQWPEERWRVPEEKREPLTQARRTVDAHQSEHRGARAGSGGVTA